MAPALIASFGIWLHAADELLVATVMPHAIVDIGGARFIAWTFALYEIGSIVAGASAAFLGLRIGLRKAMSSAALLYAAGCVASAAAPDMAVMLAGRLAQGLGGGALTALSFFTISAFIPPRLMARAMGMLSLVWGLSAFLGPLIGGAFAEIGFWRGSFWSFAVQAVLLAALIRLMLARPAGRKAEPGADSVPALRLALLSAGVVAIAAAGIDVALARSTALVAAGMVLIWLFLRLDRQAGAGRLLPERPFDLRLRTGAGMIMIVCFSFATIPISVYGPVLMQQIHGASPIVAGYVLALASIGWSVVSILVSGAPESRDARTILVGMAVVVLSVLGLVYAVPAGPLVLLGLFTALLGAGFGLAWTFVLRRMTSIAPAADRERLATVMPTATRFGYAAGAACAGIIANGVGFSATMDPATAASVGTWVFAAMVPAALIGMAAAWIFAREGKPAEGAATLTG
jgi:MFS family permease